MSKKNPDVAMVYFSRPFINTVLYDFDTIAPVMVDTLFINPRQISFTFIVNGKEYDRIQSYEPDQRPEKTDNMKVIYRKDRPEIGYLVE